MEENLDYEIRLLEKLVAFNTNSATKENYRKCAKSIAKEAEKLGLSVKVFDAHAPDGKPRPNLVIEMNKKSKETMLMLCHYDTVAPGSGWKTDPLTLTRKGNRLYGRGTSDDKGAIAAAIGALRELQDLECKRNVKLAVVCDEEVGGKYGAKFLCTKKKHAIKSNFALSVDVGNEQIFLGCSGVLRFEITIKGRAGHAAYPHKTPNVIHKTIPFLKELLKYRKIRESKHSVLNAPKGSPYKKVWGRFAITILGAGYKINVIPEKFVIGCDVRALPEENVQKVKKEFLKFLKKKLKKYKLKADISVLISRGYVSNPKNKFVKEAIAAARKASGKKLRVVGQLGAEDGRWLAQIKIPTIGFGPGGGNIHGANEYISLRDLALTKETIKELVIGHRH